MLSFHNDIEVKRKYVARTEAHRKADNIIRGTGWNGLRGCAVGCTLEAYNHSRYPIELGLPLWLAHLEDTIFEHMSADRAMLWPSEFLLAIPLGVTEQQLVHNVKAPFLIAILQSALGSFDSARFPRVAAVVQGSIALWQRDDIGSVKFQQAAYGARAAAYAAAYGARAAADAAAYAAADAAAYAAYAARAADAAAYAAAYGARAADAAAPAAKFDSFADTLLELLRNSATP